MSQNPLDVPLHRTKRLTHTVVIGFLQHPVSPVVDPHRELGGNEGRAGGVDLIQDSKYPLLHQFGPHLTGGLTKNICTIPVWLDEGLANSMRCSGPCRMAIMAGACMKRSYRRALAASASARAVCSRASSCWRSSSACLRSVMSR